MLQPGSNNQRRQMNMHTNSDRKNILIIDDALENIKVINQFLNTEYNTFFATSGHQAVELITHNQPDLILLDIIMPELDGFQICKLLKDLPQTQDIPIIFMTGLTDTANKIKGFAAGAVDYITKPFQAEELMARVKTHLELQQMRQNLEELVLERTTSLTRKTEQLRQEILTRKKLDQALNKSEKKYREIFNAINEAVLIFAADTMTLLDVNQTMLKMTGFSHEEVINLQAACLSADQAPFTPDNLVDKLTQTDKASHQVFDWLIRLKNEDKIWVEISLKRSSLANQPIIILVARDITKRKQAQKEKEQLEEQLLNAQKMEAIGTLAGGIAHDFNNILTPLIGFAEMVLQNIPEDSPDYERQLAVIKASDRAAELIQQILSINRHTQVKLQYIKVQPIIEEILKFIRSSIPATIEIKTNIAPDGEGILANPTLIHQIVMNLCINAYHAMEEDGGILKISLANIKLADGDIPAKSGLKPRNYLEIEISDTGQGMSAEVQERIFDPYYTTKSLNKGTGLGLSVVHGIVQSLNGYISVSSELETGSTFRLLLPSAGKNELTQTNSISTDDLKGTGKILVVDDEELLLHIVKEILQEYGYTVISCCDSNEALVLFQKQAQEFDLVITDMNMPKMSGLELTRKILAIRQDMPIILCTGFSEMINEEKARAAGISDYIIKPIIKKDLLIKTRNLLTQTP